MAQKRKKQKPEPDQKRPVGRPRMPVSGLPIYDSIASCANAVGIPVPVLRKAKKSGCPAFRSNRVHLGELLPWLFAQGEDSAVGNWADALVEAKAKRERLKLEREKGEVIGVFAAARDITEMKRAEERIRQQSREILELSTPVMQVWQGVVAVPLIGSLDSQRTQQFMERLLERIVETNSPVALVDIMGVPTIDTQTAQHLIETITAVRLLGAQVVLTGVRPAIAQTLVHLGVDLSGIITRSSLAAGLVVALDMLKLKVITTADQR